MLELKHRIQTRNEMFLQSRRDDPSVHDREYALQSLDLAYHKYREISRHLEEGLTVLCSSYLLILEVCNSSKYVWLSLTIRLSSTFIKPEIGRG